MSPVKILPAFFILCTLSLWKCSDAPKQPEIDKYISGYTSGTVLSDSPLYIYLTEAVDNTRFQPDEPLPTDILKISPALKGRLYLKDEKTLEFIPEERFRNGETYRIKFRLGALQTVPKAYEYFNFTLRVVPLQASFSPGNLTINQNNDTLLYQASFYTSDYMSPQQVQELVQAELDGQNVPIEWEHRNNVHRMKVGPIHKKDNSNKLLLRFGKEVTNGPTYEVNIPDKNQFQVLDVQLNGNDRKSLRIDLSQIVDPAQNLEGLITLAGINPIRYKIDGNSIYLYYDLSGKQEALEVTVHKGIKSSEGKSLEEAFTQTVFLPSDKPAVQFIGNGIITPADGKVLIPFSAVALKAIDLQIIKVFNQNMNFFLQQNSYNGEGDLMRTARPVFRKKIELAPQVPDTDLNRWNDFTINLSDLVELEKGVIYRIEIRFKRSYTTLACADSAADRTNYYNQDWNGNDSYYNDYYYGNNYNWKDRDDPCTDSYYTGNRFISKNIINTSLGLLAKRGADNTYFIAVNDIATAQPVANCTVSLYDYQNQKLDSVRTDNNGFAYLQTTAPAFIVQARKNNDKAWLKISDATSLSLSNFDVSGEMVQSGLKGFIYGERGVWRPGDPLYLSFILEDREEVLPDGHPIIAQLIDPQGNLVQTEKTVKGKEPIYCFRFLTPENAPTGYWKAVIKIGGSNFYKSLRIETVKPNRLSIDMIFPDQQMVGKGLPDSQVKVKTRWLNGASTPGRKAITEVRLNRSNYSFKNYPDYTFNNVSGNFEPYSATLFEGTTDQKGDFSFDLNKIQTQNAPGILQASFTTRVFEEGGDFSISTYSTRYSPYTQYVGIKLPASPDGWYPIHEKVRLNGILLNPSGEKIKSPVSVRIEVYELSWRWWWDSNVNSSGLYINRSYKKPVYEKQIKAVDGNFSAQIQVPAYGRYSIQVTDEASGHTSTLIAYFGSWADYEGQDMATMLNITTDKKSYRAGEKVKVSFPSSRDGVAIVSLENGSSFRDIRRIPVTAGSTGFEFETTAGMCPNLYVYVTLIQPQEGRDNDRPIRLYGVVNVNIEDAGLHLQPEIGISSELRPGETFTVTVSEKEKRAMEYTLAIVDEGLLALTSFRTPSPFPAFYSREALGVKTWDFYDFIFGAYGARLERAFAIGGDEALQPVQDEKNNRFRPVVLFEGPCHLNPGEKQTLTFRMPEYIGEVRAMLVAATDAGEYGSASASALVKKPLMLSVALPRVFTPGDTLEIPVTVFAMNDKIRNVRVKASAGSQTTLIGKSVQEVEFTEQGEKLTWFKLAIQETTGKVNLKFTATSGSEKAETEEQIDIRIPNPPISRIESKLLQPGQKTRFTADLQGAEPVAILEISTIPPLNLGERLNDLIHYPHGCAEQIISTAFPQIALGQLLELTPARKKEIENNVKTVLSRLSSYQTTEGGFAYWPGEPYTSSWVSTYAAHFMVTASQKGYHVPGQLLQRDLEYLKTKANSYHINNYYDETEQGYRLYVLALAGKPDMAAMNRMKERQLSNPAAQWLLASAYALCNYPDIARNLIRHASREIAPYRQTGGTFGSALRDKAIILQSMVYLGMQQEAYQMLEKISSVLSSSEWLSTQTTAFALVAATEYVEKFVGTPQNLTAEISTAGKKQEITIPKTVYQQQLPVKNGQSSVEVANAGKNRLYTRLFTSVSPFGIADERIMSGLSMSLKYEDASGKSIHLKDIPQGLDIIAEISIKNTGIIGTYQNLALTYMLPSGFEIINDRLTGNKQAFREADYTDIRDDRYNVYFSLNQNQTKTFRFRFNAAFPGVFLCPAIRCSAMYDNTIQAVLPGGKVEIHHEN